MNVKSAYIHIPFYHRACTYCGFDKYFVGKQPVGGYLDTLISEIQVRNNRDLETIYVGGSTSTALDMRQLERPFKAVNQTFTINGEFSFEANLDELTYEKATLLEQYGVSRVSMGVQTFKPGLLKILGRAHKTEDIYDAISHARKTDIELTSLDLIYHLPQQTIDDFKNSLEHAIALDIDHISSYGLILEPKAQFYNLYRKEHLKLSNEGLEAEVYRLLMERMKNSPFHQYEVSNFGKLNHESNHNKVYRLNEEYYGFGTGASGHVDGAHYTNLNLVNHYIEAINKGGKPILSETSPTYNERMEEEIFLGLRMNQGVSKGRFKKKFNKLIDEVFGETTKDLRYRGPVKEEGEFISLTERGKVIGNEVFEAFLLSS